MGFLADAVHTETYKGYNISITYDQYPANPRGPIERGGCSNAATMITWERDYSTPDDNWGSWGKYDDSGPDDFRAWLKERQQERHSKDPGVVYLWLDREAYNGGLDTMEPDHHRADYADGVIYMTYEEIRKEWSKKKITPAVLANVREVLEGECKVYSLWATGQVFDYVIGDDADEIIESCGGMISYDPDGDDYALQSAREEVDGMIARGKLPAASDEDCEGDAEEEIAEYAAHMMIAAPPATAEWSYRN